MNASITISSAMPLAVRRNGWWLIVNARHEQSARSTRSALQPLPPDHSGSALIVAIWIIGLLSLLISSFAFDMQIQGRITSYSRKKLKAEYLAKAGIEETKMLMSKAAQMKGQTVSDTKDQAKPWYGRLPG